MSFRKASSTYTGSNPVLTTCSPAREGIVKPGKPLDNAQSNQSNRIVDRVSELAFANPRRRLHYFKRLFSQVADG